MIDTNRSQNTDPKTDKDRKKKAVKRDRKMVESEDDDDEDAGGSSGKRKRSKKGGGGEGEDYEKRKNGSENVSDRKKPGKLKIYANECDSDVIYDQDTEDEILFDDFKQSKRS